MALNDSIISFNITSIFIPPSTCGLVLSSIKSLNIFQCVYGSFIFFLNVTFLILLYQNRRRISRKRYALVANLAVCDVVSSIAVVAQAWATLSNCSGIIPFIVLETALSLGCALVTVSYNVLLWVQ